LQISLVRLGQLGMVLYINNSYISKSDKFTHEKAPTQQNGERL